MPLGKILWEKIDVISTDDVYLFAFTDKFRQLLFTLVDRLHWRAVYDGTMTALEWDALQTYVDEGITALMSNITLQDLIDAQEATTRAIYETSCCSAAVADDVTVTDGPTITPVDMEPDDPPYDSGDDTTWFPDLETDPTGATDYADLADIADYICRSAEAMFDLLLDMLTIAGWFHSLAYGINAIVIEWVTRAITRVWPTAQGTLVAFGYEQLASLLEPWAEELDQTMLDNARAELELARAAIVCAIANADGYAEAITDVSAVLSTILTSTVMYTWLTSGGVIGFIVALVFRGWADPEDYECTCAAPQVETSFFTQYSTTCDVPNPNLVEYPLPREHLTTNVAREFQSVNHRTECSAVSRIDVMLRDDDLANDPIAAPTSFKARYTTFVPDTDAGQALRFYSSTWTILAEYTNAQIVEGDWYTAPANTVRVMWTFDKFNDTVVAELMITEE